MKKMQDGRVLRFQLKGRADITTLLIIVLLIVSMAISKSAPRAAGILDLSVGALILFFLVIPGRADVLDWIFMFLFFAGGAVLTLGRKTSVAKGSSR